MKTVFKLGQKAYDQINFPDKEGRVVRILNDKDHKFYIGVFFKGENFPFFYNNEGCLSGRKIQTLSTNPYKVILEGFEQKPIVPTFEEAWTETNRIYEPKSEYDKEEFGGYPSQELANAAEALRRLLFLRDYYNEGWQPDWKDNNIKYVIECYENELRVSTVFGTSRVMYFKSKDVTEKFLEEQKELLEIAKPLL